MKKIFAIFLCFLAVSSCSKHDPILPGERHDIFDTTDVKVVNKEVPNLSEQEKDIFGNNDCEYRQDSLYNIWHGEKKIYNGFATDDGFYEADTTYGKIGVKVCIYKGEVLPEKKAKVEGGEA